MLAISEQVVFFVLFFKVDQFGIYPLFHISFLMYTARRVITHTHTFLNTLGHPKNDDVLIVGGGGGG